MRERSSKKSGRAAGQNFYGEEKLGGWDFVGPGTSHFLSPRYKVCMIEREGFYFLFLLLFIYLFFLKGFDETLMYCPKKKKRKKKKKENQQ